MSVCNEISNRKGILPKNKKVNQDSLQPVNTRKIPLHTSAIFLQL